MAQVVQIGEIEVTKPESVVDIAVISAKALEEARDLAADILKDIELSKVDLAVVVLKTMRLARLLNDFDAEKLFRWEGSGYPVGEHGVSREVWSVANNAGRTYFSESKDGTASTERMYKQSVGAVSSRLETAKLRIQAADTYRERSTAVRDVALWTDRIVRGRSLIYDYALRRYYELKFSNAVGDTFGRIRSSIDSSIGSIMPDAVRKLSSVDDNLNSNNPEDWANAAHSCRRLLEELADAVFPPQDERRIRHDGDEAIEIKLGAENYKNRIMAFIDDSSKSESFEQIVGSHLSFMGERLDAILSAAQKGSHSTLTKREAERCVVYTYLLVGDILSLKDDSTANPQVSVGSIEEDAAEMV